jgi:hypothetical protein
MTLEEQEAKIHESQRELIKQRFDEEVANNATYSWQRSDDGKKILVTTRVYWTRVELPRKDRTAVWYKYLPKPCLLQSEFLANGSITHTWEEKA